ncbi:membrane protein [Legionella norrlandica]|uniref:Membrane protein n=1 Tax=Legionella norrlandica TaxID=1498499 RepID=A0A0A2SSV6_9GAMM|nr:hypothetical protein [Legionella norrlandica]KGP63817.1 membrane protein [Legionella norrlandica]
MQGNMYENSKLHIVGIICLVISLGLFFFSIYIIPYLIWGLYYDVPDFVSNMISYAEDQYYYSTATSRVIVWLIFFVPSLITGYFSYYISNYIDKKNLKLTEEFEEKAQEELKSKSLGQIRDSTILGIKIILLMILILAVIFLLQTLISF